MAMILIDYLNFTIPNPGFMPGQALEYAAELFASVCRTAEPGEIEAKGLHGYGWTRSMHVPEADGRAILAAGGANPNTIYFSIPGAVCRWVDFERVRRLLEREKGRITRIDLALDDLEGRHTVHEVREAYQAGKFRNRGQMPSQSMAGPWDCPEKWGQGLTYYIGRIQNGKTLCVYEKGKQLGDSESPWVRFEVRLSRVDRDIPLQALSKPDAYFFGAYPWLETLADVEVQPSGFVLREQNRIGALALLDHARRSYGKLISYFKRQGVNGAAIAAALQVPGTPRRLNDLYLVPEVGQRIAEYVVGKFGGAKRTNGESAAFEYVRGA